jgi:hypothetical protein
MELRCPSSITDTVSYASTNIIIQITAVGAEGHLIRETGYSSLPDAQGYVNRVS